MTDRPLLLPYQNTWVSDHTSVKVCVKSRRIGITWATAADCVLDAASGASESWYMAYDEGSAKEFVRTCTDWVELLGLDADPINAIDAHGMNVFVLEFKSGCRISAMTSSTRNLRGKQGRVIVDEAAYHPDLPGVLKAALALLMWGGRVEIISTHNGVDNPFNVLVEDIKSGTGYAKDYSLHEIPLDAALEQGLYVRRCEVRGEIWTPEGQQTWRDELCEGYGIGANEELHCIPNAMGAGDWFSRKDFPTADDLQEVDFRKRVKRRIRCWDFAATPVSPDNRDPDWTRGVLVCELETGQFVIEDVVSARLGPADVHRLLLDTARADGRTVEVGMWIDPGSAGKADADAKVRDLQGHAVHTVRAAKDKKAYAKAWANIAKRGGITVLRRGWTAELFQELESFPSPKAHDDAVDCLSLAFQLLTDEDAAWASALSRLPGCL